MFLEHSLSKNGWGEKVFCKQSWTVKVCIDEVKSSHLYLYRNFYSDVIVQLSSLLIKWCQCRQIN